MGQIRRLQEKDLYEILQWRNSESVRTYMFNKDIIEYSEHLEWFKRNKNSSQKILLVYEEDDKLIGYISFTKLYEGDVVEWSFHVNPSSRKGSGTRSCEAAIEHAFKELGIRKIFGQVIDYNEKSKKLHQRLGFIEEGILKRQFNENDNYYDIYCYGKFNEEV